MRALLLLLLVSGGWALDGGLSAPAVLLPDGRSTTADLIASREVRVRVADDDVVRAAQIAGERVHATPTVGATATAADLARAGETMTLTLAGGEGPEGTSTAVKILLLITVLAVAPGFLMMVTSFTRIIIVLGFVRRALGTQTLPPNQVLLGLALFMTLFVMAPTLSTINEQAVQPYMAETISEGEAIDAALAAVKEFMARQTRKNDLSLFIRIAGEQRPASIDEVGFLTLVPAFVTSELKTAFQMGFIIFLPFLIIDLVVAAVLMALGMMMLPPVMVSMPFKILLFVLVDGWALLMQSLVASYAGGG